MDGLYASWALDDAFAKAFSAKFGYACYDTAPFVLEGGSIHSDGEGTLLVTETRLLEVQGAIRACAREIEEQQNLSWHRKSIVASAWNLSG